MSARKKQRASDAEATRGLRLAERQFKKSIGNPDDFFAVIDTAAELMRQARSRLAALAVRLVDTVTRGGAAMRGK